VILKDRFCSIFEVLTAVLMMSVLRYVTPCILVYISKRMGWAGHVARMGDRRGVLRVLVGKSEGKRPLGRRRRRWEDNIMMDLQEVG
jgi:hypothetical protein